MERKESITVKLTVKEREEIENRARENQKTLSAVTRELIYKGMKYNDWLVNEITKVLRRELENAIGGLGT